MAQVFHTSELRYNSWTPVKLIDKWTHQWVHSLYDIVLREREREWRAPPAGNTSHFTSTGNKEKLMVISFSNHWMNFGELLIIILGHRVGGLGEKRPVRCFPKLGELCCCSCIAAVVMRQAAVSAVLPAVCFCCWCILRIAVFFYCRGRLLLLLLLLLLVVLLLLLNGVCVCVRGSVACVKEEHSLVAQVSA